MLVISGCTSIPLSSMLKMATFGDDKLLAVEPSQVRVRLSVTSPAELQTKDVRLVLKFEHKGKKDSEYKYRLKLIETSLVDPITGWFTNQPKKFRYDFKLESLSRLEFKRLQKEMVERGSPDRYYWTVYYHLKNKVPEGSKIVIDLELKLAIEDDFFYLLKDAPMVVNTH